MDPTQHLKLTIHYNQVTQRFAKRLGLGQRVASTAIVYFKRFFVRNAFQDIDPMLALVTSVYTASKIEESPVNIKHVCSEADKAFGDHPGFPYDQQTVAKFEFYLLEELRFSLIVFHPYRPLQLLAKRLGVDAATATYIINDSYHTDVHLLYPPHLIAMAAIYLADVQKPAHSAEVKAFLTQANADMRLIVAITQDLLHLYNVWNQIDDVQQLVASIKQT